MTIITSMNEIIGIFDAMLKVLSMPEQVETSEEKTEAKPYNEDDPFSLKPLPRIPNLFILKSKKRLIEELDSFDESKVSVKALMLTFCQKKECNINIIESILGEQNILSALGIGTEIRLEETLNKPGTIITQIIPEGKGYKLQLRSGTSILLEPGSSVQIGTETSERIIEKIIASSVLYSPEEITTILKHEFLGNNIADFEVILSKWGISERGMLADGLQLLIEKGIIERKIELAMTMNDMMLTDLFFSNACSFYMPLIYHQFQKDDFEALLKQYPLVLQVQNFKEKVLKSEYFHFAAIESDLHDKLEKLNISPEQELSIFGDEDTSDCFLSKLKAIIMGGSMKNDHYRPHWFNKEFIDRWHGTFQALNETIIDEHFPDIRSINDKSISIIDPRDGVFKQFDLLQTFGKHYDALKHLFSPPEYAYHVISPYMSWMTSDPSMLYDGVTVSEDVSTGKTTTSNQDKLDFSPRFVQKYISIHPIELLCADVFGWTALAKQTIHHEIVHRLQEKYVQCFMSIGYLQSIINPKQQLRPTFSKRNYEYLEEVAKDINPSLLQALIRDTMSHLYIKERIAKEEQASYNLEDRVMLHGGHTDPFSEIVNNFNKCEVAMKERNAFLKKILGPMSWRSYGRSLGWGYVWACSITKKLE